MRTMSFMELLVATNKHVTGVDYFWLSIGMSIAVAMLIGATLYNGDLKRLAKGYVTLGSYTFFLFLINAFRLIDISKKVGIENDVYAHAGLFTLFYVSMAYFIGMFIGVSISRYFRKSIH